MSSSSPHGTRARYVAGCHCLPCTAANRAYRRAALAYARQRTRLAPATGQRWTPAEDDYLLNGPGTVLDRAVHLRRSYLAAAKRLTRLRPHWTPAEDDYLLNGPGTVLDRAVHLRRSYLAAAKRLTRLRAQ